MKKFILLLAFLVSTNVVLGQQFKETTNIINVQDSISHFTYKFLPGETFNNLYFQLGNTISKNNVKFFGSFAGNKNSWSSFTKTMNLEMMNSYSFKNFEEITTGTLELIALVNGKEYMIILHLEQR
jgi:hypothetical protein